MEARVPSEMGDRGIVDPFRPMIGSSEVLIDGEEVGEKEEGEHTGRGEVACDNPLGQGGRTLVRGDPLAL